MSFDLAWGITYDAFILEAWPLVRAHWAEVGSHRGVLRLDVDHDKYRSLERSGVLHILTARSEKALVGYMFLLVSKHPRDKGAVAAMDDVIYVQPAFRRLGIGWKMMGEAERFAGECGAHVVFFHAKARRRNTRYLERAGFKEHEIVYTKVIALPHQSAEKAAE